MVFPAACEAFGRAARWQEVLAYIEIVLKKRSRARQRSAERSSLPPLDALAHRTGGKLRRQDVSNDKDSRYKESDAVPIDPEGEQRELEAAGWERVDVQGKIFWLNPESGHRYPQGPAIRRLRQQRHEDAERERDEA
jgi:hypothetical protein